MHNIEFKANVPDLAYLRTVAQDAGCRYVQTMQQTDLYFNYPAGRLKLRTIDGDRAELIRYERPDAQKSRTSTYTIVPLDAKRTPEMIRLFIRLFGTTVTVKKQRELWMYKHTRIHLDTVVNLGTFVELETVAKRNVTAALQNEHAAIKKLLELNTYKPVAVSYSDLLKRKK